MKEILTTYTIEITETLQRIVEIETASLDDALTEIRRQYNEQEIILDSSDYIDTVISGCQNEK